MTSSVKRFLHDLPFWQATIFPSSLLFLLSPAFSDVSTTLYTGITHSNNLEVQAGNDILLDDEVSLSRTGLETGLTLAKQSLNYAGGYSLQADVAFNKDLSANDDISRLSLSASKLSALTPDWLLRSQIGLNAYDNQALPTNSYKGLLLDTTLGYLSDRGGGTDFSLSLKRERHDQLSSDTYDMTRSSLGVTHYFSHTKESSYWSLQAALTRNNASDSGRDYDSLGLGVRLNRITWGAFNGQLGVNWQHDSYDQPVSLSMVDNSSTQSSLGNMSTGNPSSSNTSPDNNSMSNVSPENTLDNLVEVLDMGNPIEKKRKDNLYGLSLQLGRPLTPSLGLQLSASLGRYDSSGSDTSEDYYHVIAKLIWKL